MEASSSLNGFYKRHKIKLAKSFLPFSFCVYAIAKSSSSLLILLPVMNCETSKSLGRAILGGFVVVDT